MTEIVYRPPRESELADCALVWHTATDDYMRKLNRPLPPPVLDPLVALLEHLLRTDPSRFIVAVQAGNGHRRDSVVGFGIALQRGPVWYLSQLYVLPEFQGRGIGHSMLRRILPAPEPAAGGSGNADDSSLPGVLALATDSAQPTSNGLYSAMGIVPRVPLLNLVGRPIGLPRRASRPLPPDLHAVAFADLDRPPGRRTPAQAVDISAAIDSIDREVLGYTRSADHRHFRSAGRLGFLYLRENGEVAGYGYSSPVGRFGPVAVLEETLTAPVIGHLIDAVEPRGALSAWVPGSNDRAIVALLRAGLRIEGFPALLCWSRPFAAFEKYLPAGPALL